MSGETIRFAQDSESGCSSLRTRDPIDDSAHARDEGAAFPNSLIVLIAILCAVAILRLTALAFNGTDLFTDEAQYWSWSREPAFGYYSKPPLIAWIIAATTPLCGDGEFCVRLPAVLIHIATSLVIYAIGLRLISEQVGFWSAVTFATLPGISLSSGIISTDVPLLLAWAVALLAFAELVRTPSVGWAVTLGIALGVGLNAKYAMAYFVPCAAVCFLIAPGSRAVLGRWHIWAALAIAALLIAPNVIWNALNSFATLQHTADNANWRGSLVHPGKALEFLAAQFGVFGPILFGALLVIAWRAGRLGNLTEGERLLIAFSLPVIAAVTVQAFLSRSLANWAAPAYVAATVLVTSVMIRNNDWRWLKGSLVLHGVIAVAIAVGTWQAGKFTIPAAGDPFARTLGNRELARLVRSGLEGNATRDIHYGAVLTDDRDIAAALLYYGRDIPVPLYVWRDQGHPRNHFELTRAFDPTTPSPVLLISRRPDGSGITEKFNSVLALGPMHVPAGDHSERLLHAFELSDPKRETMNALY